MLPPGEEAENDEYEQYSRREDREGAEQSWCYQAMFQGGRERSQTERLGVVLVVEGLSCRRGDGVSVHDEKGGESVIRGLYQG